MRSKSAKTGHATLSAVAPPEGAGEVGAGAREAATAGNERRGRRHWTLEDIPWHGIRREKVEPSGALFYMLAAASLMESATDLYTANLIDYFVGDDEITSWLKHSWLPEELQLLKLRLKLVLRYQKNLAAAPDSKAVSAADACRRPVPA